ncbi:hypothetical protein GY45DRAFT_298561 [Cubamyces sp. BRFM 1775]|nr:hypothetical protein GY45DRAFT_298561 [Cubamyces sp. BRFM 1775]
MDGRPLVRFSLRPQPLRALQGREEIGERDWQCHCQFRERGPSRTGIAPSMSGRPLQITHLLSINSLSPTPRPWRSRSSGYTYLLVQLAIPMGIDSDSLIPDLRLLLPCPPCPLPSSSFSSSTRPLAEPPTALAFSRPLLLRPLLLL